MRGACFQALLSTTMGGPVVFPGTSNVTEPFQSLAEGSPAVETVTVGTLAIMCNILRTVAGAAVTPNLGEVASDMLFLALETQGTCGHTLRAYFCIC